MGIERRNKKEEKNLQLSINCSHFICSCWYFLFVLFCIHFFVVQCPCEYVPNIRSVCSFNHLLLHSCLSQRGFFFYYYLLLVEWWDAYFGRLHCAYSSETFFTYLWREFFFDRPCFYYYSSYMVMPWWFRMRKTDNAIILLHSVVSHTLKKKRRHRASFARVLRPFSIRFRCLWRSHVWQWTSHH